MLNNFRSHVSTEPTEGKPKTNDTLESAEQTLYGILRLLMMSQSPVASVNSCAYNKAVCLTMLGIMDY